MVTADRNSEDVRNGKRSRGPSPNGHLSDDSSATDDSEHENGMRVGDDYQAKIPPCNPGDAKPEPRAEAMLVWAPHPDLPETKINEYVGISKEKYGYNTEQALGMLFWHKHNVEKALADLQNFTPFPDEWTVEDKVLFEQAFSFHGKSFHRIRQMLPDKSIASLVKYYYSWKKTRSRTSLMDRQARKLTNKADDSDFPDDGSGNSDSDFEATKENGKEGDGKNVCSNCGAGVAQLHSTPKGGLCGSCYQYWRRTGVMRSSSGAKKLEAGQLRHNPMKKKSKPPRGMYLDNADLRVMATGPPQQGDALIKSLEAELVSLKRQVQNNKQIISMQKHKTSQGIEPYRPPESALRINSRWTNEELLLGVQGVRKYGKNFKAIAEVIGNKTESHVRSYFVNYRRRYNLDEVLADYEAEHPSEIVIEDDNKMDIENSSSAGNNGKTAPESAPAPAVAQTTPSTVTAATAPPPLLKQSPAVTAGAALRQPPPLQNQNRLHSSLGTKSTLQNPPPLIRPNSVPIMPNSKKHYQHGPPPQLTGRD